VLDNQVFFDAVEPPGGQSLGHDGDAAMAMGWDFELAAGERAVINFTVSTSPTSTPAFHLKQSDADGTNNVYLYSTIDISKSQAPVDADKDGYPAAEDCNDNDGAVNPGAAEVCDGIDNNCDQVIDAGCNCTNGAEQPCGTDVGECQRGTLTCVDGQWGACEGEVGPATEVCNGLDDNCDGTIDDNPVDAGGACTSGTGACEAEGTAVCNAGVLECNAVPGDPTQEVCDGLDNDCDGLVDNGDQSCLPDLMMKSVSKPPKQKKRGKKFTIKDRTRNIGETPSMSSKTCFYLSKNKRLDGRDKKLGCRKVPSLAPGEYSKMKTKVKIPKNTRPGKYYILACADSSKRVNESNEKNNCRVGSRKIKVMK